MKSETIYGKNPVKEAIIGEKRKIHSVEITKGKKDSFLQELITFCEDKKIPVKYIEKENLSKKAGSHEHQGIIAHVDSYGYFDIEEILSAARDKGENPLLVILDHIKDPQNLGAIIRTVEASGAHGIVIPRRRSVEVTPAVVKASSGASEFVKISQVSNIARTINELQKKWIWIVGCEGDAAYKYYEINYNIPVAIVLGSEGEGLSNLISKNCDYLIKIPMYGNINSLNVATSCGIVVYEALRHRQ